jgi:hypothetical protein
MPVFIMTSQHTAESCPIHNEKERKWYLEAFPKIEELTQKHGIKTLAACVVMPEHMTYMIFEVPSADLIQKLMAEPFMLQFLAKQMSEIKPAMSMEESMKMLIAQG